MLPSTQSQFVTSCAESFARQDPAAPSPINSASNVPNATDVATVFVISQNQLKLAVNTTDQVQKEMILSDGSHLISMLTNGTQICENPLLLSLINGNAANDLSIWWTITETVAVDFYNRVPIFLPPGRTHSIIINTTRFPLSNMLITETTINNRHGAADIAQIFVNKNRLATPYAHLHECPTANTTLLRRGEPVTQYVVVIPPDIYASNPPSFDDQPPSSPISFDSHFNLKPTSLGELEQYAMQSWQSDFGDSVASPDSSLQPLYASPETPFHVGRPFFFIWIENTSNFTLNYTIRVTQSIQDHLDLTSGPISYTSPYLFTAFFNFSKEDVLSAMDQVQTPDDSRGMVEMIFDLTTFQETFVSRRPVTYLGIGYYPTSLHYNAKEQAITTDDPNKPLLEIFMRFHHRLNITLIPDGTIFYLRLDGVSYSQKGYIFQPMMIRPKSVHPSSLPFRANFTGLSQEWIVFNFEPSSSSSLSTSTTSSSSSSLDVLGSLLPPQLSSRFLRAFFSVDSGMNPKIQAFESSGYFPTELKHDRKFKRENENWFVLCYEMDLTKHTSVSLWNPSAFTSPMDVYFSLRETDACMVELTPTIPIRRGTLVILITLGAILALLLILFAFYLCARPKKTEFLTASEEEAAKIRAMSRSHADVQNAEAADYDKVPFLVRDTTTGYYHEDYDDDDDGLESDHDGLIRRRSRQHQKQRSGSSFAAAAFGGNEYHSISDNDSIGSDSEYY